MTVSPSDSDGFRTPQRRQWLCIAYAFPPINRSGTHRTLAFVRHLHRLGWDATVLTVDPTNEPLDENLLHRVPSYTSVIRTPWIDIIERLKSLRQSRRGHGQCCAIHRPANRQSPIDNRQSLRDWV